MEPRGATIGVLEWGRGRSCGLSPRLPVRVLGEEEVFAVCDRQGAVKGDVLGIRLA